MNENIFALNIKHYRGSSPNPPGGWGFFSPLWAEASQKKNPTLNFAFLVFFMREKIMRKFPLKMTGKRIEPTQRTLTSLCRVNCPKFVAVSGVHSFICPYCHHKFRAAQGLVAHK